MLIDVEVYIVDTVTDSGLACRVDGFRLTGGIGSGVSAC